MVATSAQPQTAHRTVPASEQAERGLLSCLLSGGIESLARITEQVAASHFVCERYSVIYEACTALYARGKLATVQNVSAELHRRNAYMALDIELGGEAQITYLLDQLIDECVPSYSADDFAESILSSARYRAHIQAATALASAAYHQDEEALQAALERLASIELGAENHPVAPLGEVLDDYIRAFDERRKRFKAGVSVGVPTGFRDLDELLGGLLPSRLYVLAARPSAGKTALALNIALNIIERQRHVLFFSLEMDKDELAQRLLSKETLIDQAFLRDGDISDVQYDLLSLKRDELHDLALDIDDRTYTLAGICTKARRVHARRPLDLIVVDYLQLIDSEQSGRPRSELRYEEVGKLSKGLKRLARDLKVPVIALAQMNRRGEDAGMPQLSHINESGRVEQDSDVVAFVHIDPSEEEKRTAGLPYKVSIVVRKHRNGPVGTVGLMFRPRLTGFYDIAPTGGK